ncbi:AMP-binding protein [Natronosporangium hydrolyticum]|uniref:AMP-binding protein n=1 Tax=Natronosporangium hydrolyticum TaxID=2811111 RepID=A0A895YLD6_9ACTN|nr:AMP-binding protein [Natronosporangium hydrolyticum]QSB16785.1 AMP-binding protein [Natronosporangium hydrolyticum]
MTPQSADLRPRNGAEPGRPAPTEIGLLVAAQAEHRPTAVAIQYGDTAVTYRDLAALATQAQQRLAAAALAPAEPICLSATKTPQTIATILACLLTGRPVLLAAAALPDDVAEQLAAVAGCRTSWDDRTFRRVAAAPDTPPSPPPAGTSFMLTTSGSTGLPKVVPLPSTAVARFVEWAAATFGIDAGSTVLNYAPINFDLCLLDVWTTLAQGGRVVLVDPDRAANGRYLADLLRRHRPQVVQAVPIYFHLLAEAESGAAASGEPGFDSVQQVMVTGDAPTEQVLAELPCLFPDARRWNVYGCTETNDSFCHEIRDDTTVPVPIGDPLPGVAAEIVTGDGAVLAGPGIGELWVCTPFQSSGYLTAGHAGRFAARPGGADGRQWFRTGDLVQRGPAGELTLVGRTDHQVKIRGVAVNTAQVEQVLLAHPKVREAAVVAVPDPVTGHRLLAGVRPHPDARLNSLTLRKHCASRVSPAAVPSTLRIIGDPLPRTTTGKVDRRAVSALLHPPITKGHPA